MKSISKFWNNTVSDNHKHFGGKEKYFILKAINRFNKHVINVIPHNEISISMEWGCGGGNLSKLLEDISDKIFITDISSKSLNIASKKLRNFEAILIPDQLERLNLDFLIGKIDIICCHNVIWHFPTFLYFEKICNIWKELKPRYICINYKASNIVTESKAYYVGENYLNGLLLPDKIVCDIFSDKYDLIYFRKILYNNKDDVMSFQNFRIKE